MKEKNTSFLSDGFFVVWWEKDQQNVKWTYLYAVSFFIFIFFWFLAYLKWKCDRAFKTPFPSTVVQLTPLLIETFRLEYEDDYEYEFQVLSTRNSKIFALQT